MDQGACLPFVVLSVSICYHFPMAWMAHFKQYISVRPAAKDQHPQLFFNVGSYLKSKLTGILV
jgi:hypothetical protein